MKYAQLIIVCIFAIAVVNRIHAAEPTPKTVSLKLIFGDGDSKTFASIPWRGKMTVHDAMKHAAEQKGGPKFHVRGSGELAFLTQINDVKNEGAGGKNWIYRVNGELGDKSFAVFPLKSGDKVEWKFGKYD